MLKIFISFSKSSLALNHSKKATKIGVAGQGFVISSKYLELVLASNA